MYRWGVRVFLIYQLFLLFSFLLLFGGGRFARAIRLLAGRGTGTDLDGLAFGSAFVILIIRRASVAYPQLVRTVLWESIIGGQFCVVNDVDSNESFASRRGLRAVIGRAL